MSSLSHNVKVATHIGTGLRKAAKAGAGVLSRRPVMVVIPLDVAPLARSHASSNRAAKADSFSCSVTAPVRQCEVCRRI